jgi:hypothetical protein
MASTALQMVNRVLKNLGQSEVASFSTTDRSSLSLEHINQAARSIFEEESWDWLTRHDGILRLYSSQLSKAYTSITNTEYDDGVTYAQIASGVFAIPVSKSRVVTTVVIGDDAKWGNSSFNILGEFQVAGVRPAC